MPNGSSIDDREFRKLDQKFSLLDTELEAFAREVGAEYIRNDGVPGRRLDYSGPDGIRRSIWFSAGTRQPRPQGGSGEPEYVSAVMAWKGDGENRRSWHRKLDTWSELPSKTEVRDIVVMMYETLNSVTQNDLN